MNPASSPLSLLQTSVAVVTACRRVWPWITGTALVAAFSSAWYCYHLWTTPIPDTMSDESSAMGEMIVLLLMGVDVIACTVMGALLGWLIGWMVRKRCSLPSKILTVSVLMLFSLPTARMKAADLEGAPPAIQMLAAKLQGKDSAEVRTAIIAQLGPPQRDVGSGLRIEQWDTAGGVLTFHPGSGPNFFDPKTKKQIRLLRTNNPAHSNLLQSYEMYTSPTPPNGIKFWLGNLRFDDGMTYRFKDSGQNMDHRQGQADNFFMRHPSGKYEVSYSAPVMRDTLLETLAEDVTIARLIFTSADGKSVATFTITSSEVSRRLTFASDKPLCFVMDTSWKNFWK